jgi:hypothetical protein
MTPEDVTATPNADLRAENDRLRRALEKVRAVVESLRCKNNAKDCTARHIGYEGALDDVLAAFVETSKAEEGCDGDCDQDHLEVPVKSKPAYGEPGYQRDQWDTPWCSNTRADGVICSMALSHNGNHMNCGDSWPNDICLCPKCGMRAHEGGCDLKSQCKHLGNREFDGTVITCCECGTALLDKPKGKQA